ncbi:hypothetical protein CEXT_138531 [Caerostris extrusa]|uniref:Uncharacterized protein n=1 Tax=Caerostris extrusa TaxID=172846 RepID=A0AAV4VN62_CAEEX|nr:hypothetical protein CEXT_138531 [Caerostris extrusa]
MAFLARVRHFHSNEAALERVMRIYNSEIIQLGYSSCIANEGSSSDACEGDALGLSSDFILCEGRRAWTSQGQVKTCSCLAYPSPVLVLCNNTTPVNYWCQKCLVVDFSESIQDICSCLAARRRVWYCVLM